jgi:hypothetical protein
MIIMSLSKSSQLVFSEINYEVDNFDINKEGQIRSNSSISQGQIGDNDNFNRSLGYNQPDDMVSSSQLGLDSFPETRCDESDDNDLDIAGDSDFESSQKPDPDAYYVGDFSYNEQTDPGDSPSLVGSLTLNTTAYDATNRNRNSDHDDMNNVRCHRHHRSLSGLFSESVSISTATAIANASPSE